jgi:PAS domain S-box-containing protein
MIMRKIPATIASWLSLRFINTLVVATVIAIAAAFAIGYYRLGGDILEKHELVDLDDETHLRGRELMDRIQALREHARRLAISDEIRKAVSRAQESGGISATNGGWRGEAVEAMKNFIYSELYYSRVSLIDAGQAVSQDVISVRRVIPKGAGLPGDQSQPIETQEVTERTSLSAIQNTDDLSKSMKFEPGEIFLSEVKRDGVAGNGAANPFVIQAAVPVFPLTFKGTEPRFFLCLTFDLEGFAGAQSANSPRHLMYLTDVDGRILVGPREFAAGTGNNETKIQELFPAIESFYSDISDSKYKRFGKYIWDARLSRLRAINVKSKVDDERLDWEARFEGEGYHIDGYKLERPLYLLTVIARGDGGGRGDEAKALSARRALESYLHELPDTVTFSWEVGDLTSEEARAYVRSKDKQELVAIRDNLSARIGRDPNMKAFVSIRRTILNCPDYEMRFIKLPMDPEGGPRARFFGLVMGVAKEELWDDFFEEYFLYSILIVAVIGIAALVAFDLIMTRPLRKITGAAMQIARGEEGVSLPTRSPGEIGALAIAFDDMLGELRGRDSELRDNIARTKTILGMAAEGIVTINSDGRIEDFNRAAEEILGYKAAEVLDQYFGILVTSDQRDPIHPLLRIVRRGIFGLRDPGHTFELVGRRKDGATFPMEVSVGDALLGDRKLGVAIIRDITDRKKAEEATEQRNKDLERRVEERTKELKAAKDDVEEAMKAQRKLLDRVNHDLRAPLSIIMLYTEDMLRRVTKGDQSKPLRAETFVDDLQLILNKCGELRDQVNDLLNLSKAKKEGVESVVLDLTEFDLAEVIRANSEGVCHLANENNNQFVLICPDGLGQMYADRTKVWRILMNLLQNSCKYVDNGTIELAVSLEAVEDAAWFVFRVGDTGPGIPKERHGALFREFNQGSRAVGGIREGVGLGLSICHLYCAAMGGGISFESEPGRGTMFCVRLPARVSAAGEARLPEAHDPVVRPRKASSTNLVLVIDDDRAYCDSLERSLVEEGYRALAASSGEEGLLLAKRHQPSAIILDVLMPGIDGWAVLAALKTDACTSDIPIIMTTVLDEKTKGLRMGADEFVSKPLCRERLSELLQKHLGGRSTGRIMVVEDDPESRKWLAGALREQGWEVDEAADGSEAIERIRTRSTDLVLLDLMLPTVDGFEVIEEIRRNKEWELTPIVVITGADLDEDNRRLLRGRVEQILQKGQYSKDDLLREIRNFIGEVGR